jgi:hypothetical protein
MKRNINAFWFEVDEQLRPRAVVLRDRRGDEPNLVTSYCPTPSSRLRINRVAKELSQSAFSPYFCEPESFAVLVGWVMHRKPSYRPQDSQAVYPPPQE